VAICENCEGTGLVGDSLCPVCNGTPESGKPESGKPESGKPKPKDKD